MPICTALAYDSSRSCLARSTHLRLDVLPQCRLVRDDAPHAPPRALPHLLAIIDRPRTEPFALVPTFGTEACPVGRGEGLVHDAEAVAGVEEVLADLWEGHRDGVAGEVREELSRGEDEFGLEWGVSINREWDDAATHVPDAEDDAGC